MNKAIEERKIEREKAIEIAKAYIQELKKDLGPLSALLYGSYARGDFNLGSDIDVLVISDLLPQHPLKRMEVLYRHIQGGIEPRGYTREELLRQKDPGVLEALNRGICLLDDGFIKSVKEINK